MRETDDDAQEHTLMTAAKEGGNFKNVIYAKYQTDTNTLNWISSKILKY